MLQRNYAIKKGQNMIKQFERREAKPKKWPWKVALHCMYPDAKCLLVRSLELLLARTVKSLLRKWYQWEAQQHSSKCL